MYTFKNSVMSVKIIIELITVMSVMIMSAVVKAYFQCSWHEPLLCYKIRIHKDLTF